MIKSCVSFPPQAVAVPCCWRRVRLPPSRLPSCYAASSDPAARAAASAASAAAAADSRCAAVDWPLVAERDIGLFSALRLAAQAHEALLPPLEEYCHWKKYEDSRGGGDGNGGGEGDEKEAASAEAAAEEEPAQEGRGDGKEERQRQQRAEEEKELEYVKPDLLFVACLRRRGEGSLNQCMLHTLAVTSEKAEADSTSFLFSSTPPPPPGAGVFTEESARAEAELRAAVYDAFRVLRERIKCTASSGNGSSSGAPPAAAAD